MIVNFFLYYRFLFMLLFPKNGTGGVGDFKCPPRYSCISTEECSERHANRKVETVMFQCEKKTKVCCSPIETTAKPLKNGPPFEEKPPEMRDYTTHRNAYLIQGDCGTKPYGNKIANGEVTEIFEFPWMVLLGLKYKNSNKFICGGTLINRRYVLTAAHCITAESLGRDIEFVRLKEHNLTTESECFPTSMNSKPMCFLPEDIPIKNIIPHPKFNKRTFKNDIALLRLSWEAQENDTAICLPLEPTKLNIKDELKLEIAGWGQTEDPRVTQSDVLRKAETIKISLKDCNICNEQGSFCPLTNNQICVEGVKSGDACKGDSGGPLMFEDSSKISPIIYQVGITSFKSSDACGDQRSHSMYTNVVHYMDWILENIKD